MKIIVETIPHETHRYPTVGDWWFEAPAKRNSIHDTKPEELTIQIRVSKLSDWRREMLVAVHELVEVLMCKHDGVSQDIVDKFDKAFEANRPEDNDDEPGDDPKAPYVRQHCIATGIERILAAELGVSWKEYEDELNSLP